MAKITGQKSQEKWLKGRNSDVAVALAVRSIFRVLPVISENWRTDGPDKANTAVVVLVLRAALVLQVAVFSPTNEAKAAAALKTALKAASLSAGTLQADAGNSDAVAVLKAVAGATLNAVTTVTFIAADTDAVNVAGAVAFNTALIALNATRTTFAAFETEFWNALSEDCTILEDGVDAKAALAPGLWYSLDKPDGFEYAWRNLQHWFNLDPSVWGFWREWYQKVLDGQYQNPDLLYDIAVLPDADWNGGPGVIAEKIAGLQAKYLPSSMPMGERIEVNPATAKLMLVPTPPPQPALFRMGLEKVRDEIAEFGDLERKTNAFSALLPVLRKLSARIDENADNPQRVFDELLLAMESIEYLLGEKFISDGVEIRALLRVFDTTCLDIRSTMEAVNWAYVRRIEMRLVELSGERKETLILAGAVVAGSAEGKLEVQVPADVSLALGQIKKDPETNLPISNAERVVAIDRTRRRVPEALHHMNENGIAIAPKVAEDLREGYTLGKILMDVTEIFRTLAGF